MSELNFDALVCFHLMDAMSDNFSVFLVRTQEESTFCVASHDPTMPELQHQLQHCLLVIMLIQLLHQLLQLQIQQQHQQREVTKL